MPVQLTYPGVYIQEKASGVKTIEGVSTSVGMFIGYTTEGPINEPRLIGSVAEYIRIFGDDRTESEMTDQVEQFYLNGGSEAWVMRIAGNAKPGSVKLKSVDGTEVLEITSKSEGVVATNLRASVDYNTSRPEHTFNLTIERLEQNSAGFTVVGESETIREISMDPASGRYAGTVITSESVLADGEVLLANPAGSAIRGYSISANGFVDLEGAINSAIDASDSKSKFNLTIGSHTVEVQLPVGTPPSTLTVADVHTAVNDALGDTPERAVVREYVLQGDVMHGFKHLVIYSGTASTPSHKDVFVTPAATNDISGVLGLGALHRGLEVGPFAQIRPQPSHWQSTLGDLNGEALASTGTAAATYLDRFGKFATALREDRHKLVIVDSIQTGTLVEITDAGDELRLATDVKDSDSPTSQSLRILRDNLDYAVSAINATQGLSWVAERVGFRLQLKATFGGDLAPVTGVTFTEQDSTMPTPVDVVDGDTIFKHTVGMTNVALGNRKRVPLDGQEDTEFSAKGIEPVAGDPPTLDDYKLAFEKVKQEVPRFNIMVLPKTNKDGSQQRDFAYGPASKTCQEQFAFLVVDEPVGGWQNRDQVLDGIGLHSDGLVKDHAAIYWPPINVASGGSVRSIQPSGSVAGIMARTDATRGVWKAPAGLEASVTGARGQKHPVNDFDSGKLNPLAVNAIRNLTQKTVVWGARTLDGFNNSGNVDYKYVPVRRFALFMEASLYEGLQTWVFEPNDEPTWAGVRRQVGSFMNGLFRQGAFAGSKPEDAYFVKIDKDTTTQNDINIGVMNVIVGFAPLKPAEFVVLTLTQKVGEIQV